ncbi:hypothetical protein JOB18_019200 [Solea senegalensis]|uniref:Uncharacterized protein n=1 Tax=Solea senegalensis TaxID=28829 RepID=A0AAV6RDN8_SOLSE|nr:hypothetical protein JOB18_019200 [Solea senegalensis]
MQALKQCHAGHWQGSRYERKHHKGKEEEGRPEEDTGQKQRKFKEVCRWWCRKLTEDIKEFTTNLDISASYAPLDMDIDKRRMTEGGNKEESYLFQSECV